VQEYERYDSIKKPTLKKIFITTSGSAGFRGKKCTVKSVKGTTKEGKRKNLLRENQFRIFPFLACQTRENPSTRTTTKEKSIGSSHKEKRKGGWA